MTYAQNGPPFNFLGHLTESQKIAFYLWMERHTTNLDDDALWYRIQSQKLRKTAAALEAYTKKQEDGITADFQKEVWDPGAVGLHNYTYKDDVAPAVVVSQMKELFLGRLKNLDEQQFQLRNIRVGIERCEDKAQRCLDGRQELPQLKQELDGLFRHPVYTGALVPQTEEGNYRTTQLDSPTTQEQTLDGVE